MTYTRKGWLAAAHGATWFRLNRHDDPEPDAQEPEGAADPVDDENEQEPEGADQLGDKGKQALERMKADRAAARRAAATEKKRADDLARKVAEFEDRDKSELERATSKAEAAAKRAEEATARAVRAEVKALATAFADVDDALVNLGGKLSDYTDDSGDIDTDAIAADLEALLERKPHLRRSAPAPEAPKTPKPDPSQGPRKDPPPTDWSKASRGDLSSELAKYGVRLR